MREILSERWLRCSAFFCWISLHFISAYAGDLTPPSNGAETQDRSQTGGSMKATIGIIFLVIVVVALLSFALFKCWQKKRRKEKYAQLIKLFEEDDDLELELGLRD